MTAAFLDKRIDDLKRVANSIEEELHDPDSKGYPGSEPHQAKVQDAINTIHQAMSRLAAAKPGSYGYGSPELE